jgi:hypothetical protein
MAFRSLPKGCEIANGILSGSVRSTPLAMILLIIYPGYRLKNIHTREKYPAGLDYQNLINDGALVR